MLKKSTVAVNELEIKELLDMNQKRKHLDIQLN